MEKLRNAQNLKQIHLPQCLFIDYSRGNLNETGLKIFFDRKQSEDRLSKIFLELFVPLVAPFE